MMVVTLPSGGVGWGRGWGGVGGLPRIRKYHLVVIISMNCAVDYTVIVFLSGFTNKYYIHVFKTSNNLNLGFW